MKPDSHLLLERRKLLQLAMLAASAPLQRTADATQTKKRVTPSVCAYTEHFQKLPIPEVCRVFKQIGVDGLDLTVRPGGHIEPRNAKRELPLAGKTAKQHGLKIMMLTTAITTPNQQATDILTACRDLGIAKIKLGYHRAGEFGNLSRRMDEVRKSLATIADFAAPFGVLPCVHVHSGPTIPSNGFVLHQLIKDLPPDRIGAYLDSYHMTITGGNGGWRQAVETLKPWIALVALKNFKWHAQKRDDIGQQRWTTDYCRLADGIAPIPDFIRTVQQAGYKGFYTLHTEYRQPVKECIRMTTDDHAFFRQIIAKL